MHSYSSVTRRQQPALEASQSCLAWQVHLQANLTLVFEWRPATQVSAVCFEEQE
jgi:hypothetical protein